jgi:hypothetical protein
VDTKDVAAGTLGEARRRKQPVVPPDGLNKYWAAGQRGLAAHGPDGLRAMDEFVELGEREPRVARRYDKLPVRYAPGILRAIARRPSPCVPVRRIAGTARPRSRRRTSRVRARSPGRPEPEPDPDRVARLGGCLGVEAV